MNIGNGYNESREDLYKKLSRSFVRNLHDSHDDDLIVII
jgi:hypothetical protein